MAWDGLRKMRFTKNGGRMELNTSEAWQPCTRILSAQAGNENYGFDCEQDAVSFLSGAMGTFT